MIEQILDILYTRPADQEMNMLSQSRQKTWAAIQRAGKPEVFAYDGLPWEATGWVWFVVGSRGLAAVRMSYMSEEDFVAWQSRRLGQPVVKNPAMTDPVKRQLAEYFRGERKHFEIDIDWGLLSGFQAEVLRYIMSIPAGQVATYGEIARALGKPNSSRAVGRALGANPMPIIIPCHRVIGANGKLTGYAGGTKVKEYLLRLEGCIA
jgi:methylated-DNA-[protein]-cysteine S-methyltransferase